MKVFRIFIKNIRTISRNWSYFFVLVFFPFFLILSSGFVLNSIDVGNINVDFIYQNTNLISQEISNFPGNFYPGKVSSCIDNLRFSRVGACVYLHENESVPILDVYYDGSNKIVEQYTKQLILDMISKKQGEILKKNSEEVSKNVKSYQVLFSEAQEKLISTEDNLSSQKTELINRKKKVESLRNDYLKVYYPLKNSENDFFKTKEAIDNNREEINLDFQNLNDSTFSVLEIINNLNSTGLSSSQKKDLDEIKSYVLNVQSFLDLYEKTYGSNSFYSVLGNVSEMYSRLDEIKNVLDGTVEDLDLAIAGIDKTISDIRNYLIKINDSSVSLNDFSNKTQYPGLEWNFFSVFGVDDPVLLSFPLLVSIIIMFTSLILSNMITSKQTHEKSYQREIISPVKSGTFLISNYLINLFFIFIQAVVLFAIGVLWVGIPQNIYGLYFFGVFLISTVFIFVGMGISYFLRSSSLSSLVTIFVIMFSFVLSSVVAPPLLTDPFVKFLMQFNPFVISMNYFKAIFIVHQGWSYLSLKASFLGFYIFVLGIFLIVSKSIHDRRIGG